jgi:hypothetical protein
VIRTGYSGRRGGVPSHVPNSVGVVVAVRGMALQGRGWPHWTDSDGDGAPTGLTSWFDPAE